MELRALTFDVYGTLIDWRGSILDELRSFGAARGLDLDWAVFIAEWKSAYRPGMERVNRADWPWTTIETMYRRRLEEMLLAYRITGLSSDEIDHLNRVWWRLRPWPDTVPGLTRLRARFVIAPLSNASVAGMVHLARSAGLPWDCIITAENARRYKPDPHVYRTALELLGLGP